MKLFFSLAIIFIFQNSIIGQRDWNDLGQRNIYLDTQSTVEISGKNDTIFVTKYFDKVTNQFVITSILIGTPFFENRDFPKGQFFVDGSSVEGNIYFNLEQKNILFIANETSTILKPDSFILENQKFKKLYPKYKNAYYKDYYESVFNKNRVELFKRYDSYLNTLKKPLEIEYEKNKYTVTYFYQKFNTYFLGINDDFIEIKNKRSFFRTFGKQRNAVENFTKSMNLNFMKESDIIKIIKFYNQL